jgi:hypothetical protein
MKVRDLYTARPWESQQQPPPNYRDLYRQTAEVLAGDCWTIDPAWLLDHPEWWEQIRTLDDKLSTMERAGASEVEYRTTLERLVKCIRDARAACEREQKQASERAVQ